MKTTTHRLAVTIAIATVYLTLGLATAAAQGYEADYEVRVEKTQASAGPQESIRFPIVVENHDDDPVRFTFEPVDLPEGAASFHVTAPAPVELEAAGGEPTSARVVLTVYTPFRNGYVDEETDITLTVQPYHAEDDSLEGEPETVTVTAAAQGFHIPGPGPAILLGGVAAAAGLVRRGSKTRS